MRWLRYLSKHFQPANDELYKAAADEKLATDPQSKEVLCYRQALWHGYQQLKTRPLSTNLFIDLVAIIKNNPIGIRRVPGVRIGSSKGEVIYTPPEGEAIIREKLSNLEQYIHADDGLDPLIKLAVIHYQFEAIIFYERERIIMLVCAMSPNKELG